MKIVDAGVAIYLIKRIAFGKNKACTIWQKCPLVRITDPYSSGSCSQSFGLGMRRPRSHRSMWVMTQVPLTKAPQPPDRVPPGYTLRLITRGEDDRHVQQLAKGLGEGWDEWHADEGKLKSYELYEQRTRSNLLGKRGARRGYRTIAIISASGDCVGGINFLPILTNDAAVIELAMVHVNFLERKRDLSKWAMQMVKELCVALAAENRRRNATVLAEVVDRSRSVFAQLGFRETAQEQCGALAAWHRQEGHPAYMQRGDEAESIKMEWSTSTTRRGWLLPLRP